MPWDERDTKFTLRIRRMSDGSYRLDQFMRVRRPGVSEDSYLQPVPDASFHIGGLGRLTFEEIEFIDGHRGFGNTDTEDAITSAHPSHDLGPRRYKMTEWRPIEEEPSVDGRYLVRLSTGEVLPREYRYGTFILAYKDEWSGIDAPSYMTHWKLDEPQRDP